MTKRASKKKHIVAQSITLTDSKGKTRIFMDGSGDGACICLFGDRDRSIELMANPDGGLHLGFHDGSGKIAAGLAITSDDRLALFLYDFRSGTQTELGTKGPNGSHQLTLYHKGKLAWTTGKMPKGGKANPARVQPKDRP